VWVLASQATPRHACPCPLAARPAGVHRGCREGEGEPEAVVVEVHALQNGMPPERFHSICPRVFRGAPSTLLGGHKHMPLSPPSSSALSPNAHTLIISLSSTRHINSKAWARSNGRAKRWPAPFVISLLSSPHTTSRLLSSPMHALTTPPPPSTHPSTGPTFPFVSSARVSAPRRLKLIHRHHYFSSQAPSSINTTIITMSDLTKEQKDELVTSYAALALYDGDVSSSSSGRGRRGGLGLGFRRE